MGMYQSPRFLGFFFSPTMMYLIYVFLSFFFILIVPSIKQLSLLLLVILAKHF